jgi:hypothetical protein
MSVNRLVNATQAPRCQHIKVNGTRCGSPARHGRDHCCFHDSAARRNGEFVLPIVEDAASLQLALNQVMQALIDKLIDQKTANTLLYALQIASANLKQLKGEQRVDQYASRLHQEYQRTAPSSENQPTAPPPNQPDRPLAHAETSPKLDIKACVEPWPVLKFLAGSGVRRVH